MTNPYKDFLTISGEITSEQMQLLVDTLNRGYELIKLDTHWVKIGDNISGFKQKAAMIAILLKRED